MAKTKRKSAQTQRKPVQSVPATPRKPIQAETAPSKQEQRGQRPEASPAAARAQTQTRSPRYQRRKASRSPWLLLGGIVVAIAVIVGIFVFVSNQGSSGGSAKPTNASVLNSVNKIDPSVFEAVNTGGLKSPITAAPGSPAKLLGPTGKPEFFYEGAEYCPYCAAQRWSVSGNSRSCLRRHQLAMMPSPIQRRSLFMAALITAPTSILSRWRRRRIRAMVREVI